jgi:hypothetical protein
LNPDSFRGARPLFVAGCQRSGTTAFTEYLNQHPRILLGLERYRRIPARTITPELFTFERILDYEGEETIRPKAYYDELLAKKDEKKLVWVGDKNPNYVLHLDVLSKNNPGAHFIVLYRPVEEVAESWEVASSNPNDPWRRRENGFERGVQIWNRALQKVQEFMEKGTNPKVLIVSYHDFFYRNEVCVPLISRFLNVEFDETVRRTWKEMSARFEKERRTKKPLTGERAEFIRENKDQAAEEWILRRIEEQWKNLEREAGEIRDLVRSLGDEPHRLAAAAVRARAAAEDEAGRARRLERQVVELEDNLAKEIRTTERLEKRNEHLALQVRDLRKQIRGIQTSRSWALLDGLNRLRTKLFAWRPGSGRS